MSYDEVVELASNLVWLATAVAILGQTLWVLRRGRTKISPVAAMTLACVICLMLLPVISISDDLMEARQAALPTSAQTWRMAAEDASVGLEIVPVFCSLLLFLALFLTITLLRDESKWDPRPNSRWLVRSLKLRPPPAFTF